MKRLVARLVSLYACLMKLYPSRYQREFGEERQELFRLALEEATSRGNRALLRFILHELHDFPASAIRANLREWQVMMNTIESKLGDEQFSWIGLLLGTWPFLFAGPLMAVLPYLPGHAAQLFNFMSPMWLATVCLSLFVGLFLGWRMNFPLWVYPYLVIAFFALAIPVLGLLGPTGLNRFNPWIATAILLFAILGLGAGALFLLSRIPRTRKIFYDVRDDWTRLSFGMLVFVAFYTGLYTGDHLPPFGLIVWLPSVVILLGAIAYLLSGSRLIRSLVLIITLGLGVFFGMFIFSGDAAWAIWPASLLVTLILSPVLVGLFARPPRTQVNEH